MSNFERLDAVSFTLAGEWFAVVDEPPSALLVDLVGALGTDARGNRTYHAAAMRRALLALVPAPDHDRLLRVLGDKRRPVDRPTLGRVLIWLTEAVLARPTPPSTASRSGRRNSGRTCGDACSSPAPPWWATRPATFSTWPTRAGSRTR